MLLRQIRFIRTTIDVFVPWAIFLRQKVQTAINTWESEKNMIVFILSMAQNRLILESLLLLILIDCL